MSPPDTLGSAPSGVRSVCHWEYSCWECVLLGVCAAVCRFCSVYGATFEGQLPIVTYHDLHFIVGHAPDFEGQLPISFAGISLFMGVMCLCLPDFEGQLPISFVAVESIP